MTNNRLNLGRLGKFAKTTGSALIQRVAGNSSARQSAPVFRVTELPLDLKLYLADFFDPGEARKVLLVSREFHETFARAVWHSIWTGLVLRRKGGISLEALKRYGHLVHILQIGNIIHLPAEFYTCVPNVMWVRIVYCEHPDIIFDANQFSALANLRRVEVRMDITKQLWFDNTSAWIYDTSRSGHVNEIILEQDSSRDSDNASMAQMYQIATNGAARRGLRFALKVRDSTPPQSSEWAELAPRITHLTVSPPHATCFGSFYDMLLKDTSLVYTNLTYLYVRVCCEQRRICDYSKFNQETFPYVTEMYMFVADMECSRQYGTPIRSIFSRKWPKITKFHMRERIAEDDMGIVVSAIPNVTSFSYNCSHVTLDLGLVVQNLQHLVSLTCFDTRLFSFSPASLNSPFYSRLRVLEVSSCRLTVEFMHFLFFAAPQVRRLTFWGCELTDSVADCALRVSSTRPSEVRFLTLYNNDNYRNNGRFDDAWIELVGAFENLKEVWIQNHNIKDIKRIAKTYPHIKVF